MPSQHEQSGPSDSPLSLFERMQIGLLSLLVTACGALAAGVWQSVNTFADKEAAEDREFRRFHSELVGEMRRLSENAGILTSADLCPVRFRLRQGDERSFPALPVLASLMSVDRPDELIQFDLGPNGVLQFGLVPPGPYRLSLQTQSGYVLEHEFQVVPGVPVDRLVTCPLGDASHLTTRIDPQHAMSSVGPDWTLVFYVERDDVTVGDWTWSPEPRRGVWVSSSPAGPHDVADRQALALATALSAEVLPEVPYMNCRCLAMAVVQFQGAGSDTPRHLGTFRFQVGSERDPERDFWQDPVYVIAAAAPRFRRSIHEQRATWSIELPLAVAREIERRLERVSSTRVTGGSPVLAEHPSPVRSGSDFVPLSIRSREHLSFGRGAVD
jgi:hypothetical protein